MRCRLGALNRVLLRVPVKQDVQFRNLGNPAPIGFPVELNCEPHSYSLPPAVKSRANRPESLTQLWTTSFTAGVRRGGDEPPGRVIGTRRRSLLRVADVAAKGRSMLGAIVM